MAEQTQSAFDLRHYLDVLWRHKWLVLQAMVIIPVIVLAISLSQPKQYQATARVMVENQSSSTISAVTGQSLGNQRPDDRDTATLAKFVVTPEILTKVKDDLGWTDSFKQLEVDVVAGPNTDANIVEITATRSTPQQAAALANAVAVAFVDWRRKSQVQTIDDAIGLLETQIAAAPRDSFARQTLLERRNQLEVLKALTSGGVTVGELAQAPAAPSSPKPLRNTMLAFIAATVLGVTLAFVRDALDTQFHSLDALEQQTSLTVITTIDELPKEYRKSGRLITLEDPRNPISEGYRLLRTNIEFLNFNHDLKTILVTSPLPSQGKTTTIANLAVVLLRAGKRVALVEGDLRRPALHKYFHLPNTVGLTSVVTGMATLEEAIHVMTFRSDDSQGTNSPTHLAHDDMHAEGLRLRLLTSGPIPPNPGEIATSQQLAEILSKLGEENDYVLLDAPPLLAVGDAATMAGRVDGLLVIVSLEGTTRRMMSDVGGLLSRVPARTLGLVVTGVTRGKRETQRYSGYYAS
jgi:capsular polysaccharide biosynthesis protein/Mrp family chromosome partitioning ATPase